MADTNGFIPRIGGTKLLVTLDKEVSRIECVFGILKVSHPDGTHSLLVHPEDWAQRQIEAFYGS